MNILITGAAGFIGSNLVDKLLSTTNHNLICIDNFDNFYDKKIKLSNISSFINNERVKFSEINIFNENSLKIFFYSKHIDLIIHLAAKAGVGNSIDNSKLYQDNNYIGTQNILDLAKEKNIKKIIFASSSSVYGNNIMTPWIETDLNLKPISPYALSKLACEQLGYVYSYLFNINFIALRFFSVYGKRQRPDLLIHKIFDNIYNNKSINIYGSGEQERDFTYIDDITDGIISTIDYNTKYDIFNLGNNKSISVNKLIKNIEKITNKKLNINYLKTNNFDIFKTCANIDKAKKLLNYNTKTSLVEGLNNYNLWFIENKKSE